LDRYHVLVHGRRVLVGVDVSPPRRRLQSCFLRSGRRGALCGTVSRTAW
jgi:hypothetical protein